YVAAACVVGILDGAWLTLTGPSLYRPALGAMLAHDFRPAPAALFYLLYLAGLCWLAVRPALASGGLRRAASDGALLGLVAYATYDLTNQATLVVWSSRITVIDIAWGMFLSAAGASAGYLAAERFSRRTPA
ncbi:MAG: DUF2177 family protein, partial [Caulobacteraceae bacterium]